MKISQSEDSGNASSRTPQLAESLQSTGQVGLRSPKSPDYPPRVSAGPSSPPSSNFVTKSSMTYGLPESMVSIGNTWKTSSKHFISQHRAEPKLDINHHKMSTPVGRTHIAVQPIQRIKAEKIKQEPTEIKTEKVKEEPAEIESEPVNLKLKVESSSSSSVPASHSKSSHSSSSSRDKNKDRSNRHHCSQCYRRSKIKKSNVGIQCPNDGIYSNSIPKRPVSPFTSSIQKSNADNLKLNLQVKSYTILENQFTKNENSIYLQGLKYKDFIHIETYPNGGATVVHMYQDEIDVLSTEQLEELAQEYFKVSIFNYNRFCTVYYNYLEENHIFYLHS